LTPNKEKSFRKKTTKKTKKTVVLRKTAVFFVFFCSRFRRFSSEKRIKMKKRSHLWKKTLIPAWAE